MKITIKLANTMKEGNYTNTKITKRRPDIVIRRKEDKKNIKILNLNKKSVSKS